MNTENSIKNQNDIIDFTIKFTALMNRKLDEDGGEIKLKDLLKEFYQK